MRSARFYLLTGMMLIGIMSVSACGKKPPQVEPPTEVGKSFPHVYPDPATNE